MVRPADADGVVDAEGVGASDDFEQAAASEFFDQQAVFRQEAGVVEAFW